MCLVCQLVGGLSRLAGTLFNSIQQIFIEKLDHVKHQAHCGWGGNAAQTMTWVLVCAAFPRFPIAIDLYLALIT